MFGRLKRSALIVAGSLLLASSAAAYYHFVHFPSAQTPLTPVLERFDLRSLTDRTVRYYIRRDGPAVLAPGDSFDSVISQIRLAAAAWNEVKTSELRVAFGGMTGPENNLGATPAIEIFFDEIPPGLIAVGGPTTRGELAADAGGVFVPITRSVVILKRDLSGQRSSSEAFFLTAVHEIGHALGLQHTLTSSVMSTSITRTTSKSKPLAIDDVAGLSLLYPTPQFRQSTGTISGRVTLFGAGVNLASVVAISPQGAAVSALTNPDGTYAIDGIPAGSYYVYVHPLPPPIFGEVSPANVVLPRNPFGEPVQAGPFFETEFYPGAKSAETARALVVRAGETVAGIDFFVRPRSSLDLYAISTYTFPANVAVPQAFLNPTGPRRFLVVSGIGLSTGSGPVPGLMASVIGGSAVVPPGGLQPYAPDPRFVQLNLDFHPFSGTGPRHLLFTLNNDIHVRPSGLHLVSSPPPAIRELARATAPDGRLAVAVAGQNLSRTTRIFFDGIPATVVAAGDNGVLFVDPPAARSQHRATVVALNEDGQSSWFMHGADSPVWEYEAREPAAFVLSPGSLPAGTEAMIEVQGINTRFSPGKTELGFGSRDIAVRGLWVVGPNRLLANVAIANSAEGLWPATVLDGLEVISSQVSFQVSPPNGGRPALHSPVLDATLGKEGAYPGGAARVRTSRLPEGVTSAALNLTVNDQPATIRSVDGGTIVFEVPPTLSPGPAVLRLRIGQTEAYPIAFTLRPAPPEIIAVVSPPDQPVGAGRPARLGEPISLRVARLAQPGGTVAADRVTVEVGGIRHAVLQVAPVAGRPEWHDVSFVLGTTVPTGDAVPLTVSIDGRDSLPFSIPITR